MSDQLYQNDLTDREWEYIKPLIPAAKSGCRKRQTDGEETQCDEISI
jgi:transposase